MQNLTSMNIIFLFTILVTQLISIKYGSVRSTNKIEGVENKLGTRLEKQYLLIRTYIIEVV